MKKRPILILAALCLLGLLLCSLLFFWRRPLEDRLSEAVGQAFGVTATVGEISWRWLPLPTITIADLQVDSPGFTLLVPQAEGILSPSFFLSGKISLARATLITPQLRMKAPPPGAAAPPRQELLTQMHGLLLANHLTIRQGTVSLPATPVNQQLHLQAIPLTDLQGTLSRRSNGVTLALTMNSPFAKSLEIKGGLDSRTLAYQLDVTGEDVASDQLLRQAPALAPSPAEPPTASPSPLPSLTAKALALHLQGQGEGWQLTVTSKQRPLELTWQDQVFPVSSLDGITVSHHPEELTVDLAGVSLDEPQLRLKGQVARRQAAAGDTSPPLWSIDLSGQELDLAAIRATILTHFGAHPLTQKVCEIVQGGRANSARFAFEGSQAEFASLAKMRIWAEAQGIPLYLPALPLQIDAASGPISILDGQLSGHQLSATIDSSQGTNGELLLDLEPDQHGFHLDLDLDVELNTLQEVLAQIVPVPRFHQELARFSQLSGQAQGHLRLGEDLRQVMTEVDVQHVSASGRYDRLPWPFTIHQGALTVLPNGRQGGGDPAEGDPLPPQVAWEGVTGQLGAHQIATSSGVVSWAKDVRLELKALDADLDLKSLIEEGAIRGTQPPLSLRELTRERFDNLSGKLSLRHSTLAGPVQRPQEWQFHSLLTGRDLKVSQPGFPDLRGHTLQAEISQQRLDFEGDFALFEQELHGIGHYRHRLFAQWQGEVSISGEIDQQLGEWLKEKRPLSGISLLKTPFRVDKFVITTPEPDQEADDLLINGTILPVTAEGQTLRLQIGNHRQGKEQIDSFSFLHGDRQGTLTYQHRRGQEGSRLSWEGEVTSETIDTFFSQPWVEGGTLRGKFSRLVEAGNTTYQGTLAATAVHFSEDSLAPELTIEALRVGGEGNRFAIEQADLSVAGSPLTLTGEMHSEAGLHHLNLQLTSPHLAWDGVQRLLERYRQRQSATESDRAWGDDLRGKVRFELGAFDYRPPPTAAPPAPAENGKVEGQTASTEADPPLTVAPLRGQLDFTPAGRALTVDQATVCGITGGGKWYFGQGDAEDSLTFSSGQAPLSFAEALPCLRIKQSLILGPFSLQGQLSGRPKAWREGNITLSSSEGIIKRMSLLSKVFTAVNFTDYLTWDEQGVSQGEGLPYNDLILKAHVADNQLILDRTFIRGKGVNVSGRGTINLADLEADLTFFIAPFKGLDWLITNLPLVGKALAGPKESILTFPVAVSGNIKSPEVTALAPTAIGSAVFELFKDTMTLPFRIFQPKGDDGQ